MKIGGNDMKGKKNIIVWFLGTVLIVGGLFTLPSCKREKIEDPNMHPPSGFRYQLSGTANPSSLIVPLILPETQALITVKLNDQNGQPMANKWIIFHEPTHYGYFEGFKLMDTKLTNASGIAQILFYLPPAADVKYPTNAYVVARFTEEGGSTDSSFREVTEEISIKIVPVDIQGILMRGYILDNFGSGVAGIPVELGGALGQLSAMTVTQGNGKFSFLVPDGWYGRVTPQSEVITFYPEYYEFAETNPVRTNQLYLDFTADFSGSNMLACDVATWDIPATGGSQVVNVYCTVTTFALDYIVVPQNNWLHATPIRGRTPDSFTLIADPNDTNAKRTGEVIVTAANGSNNSVTIEVNQAGNDVSAYAVLEVDRPNITFTGCGSTINVNAYNSGTSEVIKYIITTEQTDWITLSKTIGATPDAFTITASENTDTSPRTGIVALTATSTGLINPVKEISIIQEAAEPSLAVSTNSIAANANDAGRTYTVIISNPSTSDVLTWTLDSDATWLGVTPVTGTTKGGVITITIQTNNTSATARTAVITITSPQATCRPSIDITVTQDGA